MKTLVTGANGMLGMAVVDELLSRDCQVRAVVEPGFDSSLLRRRTVEVVAADVLDPDAMVRAAYGCERIIHVAAVVSYWPRRSVRTSRVNFEGTTNLIEAAVRAGARRLVFVGSASSFGPGSLEHPGDERTPYAAGKYRASYFDSKIAAQRAVLAACGARSLPAVVVNPTFMIGPYANARGSASLVLRLAQGRMPLVPPAGRNFVFSRDAAYGVVSALDHGRCGECYILGGENLTYAAAFARICSVLGVEPPARRVAPVTLKAIGIAESAWAAVSRRPPEVSSTLAWMMCDDCYYSSQKAGAELALPHTPIEEAAGEAWEWYRRIGFEVSAVGTEARSERHAAGQLAVEKGERS